VRADHSPQFLEGLIEFVFAAIDPQFAQNRRGGDFACFHGKGNANHIWQVGFNQRPIDGIRKELVNVLILHVRIWTKELEVFPVPNSGHQRDSEQMS
jgi:hypothetical protein